MMRILQISRKDSNIYLVGNFPFHVIIKYDDCDIYGAPRLKALGSYYQGGADFTQDVFILTTWQTLIPYASGKTFLSNSLHLFVRELFFMCSGCVTEF